MEDDFKEAIDLLEIFFDLYEDGCQVESADDPGSVLGQCVELSDEDFDRCVAILERLRPRGSNKS